MIIPTVGRVVWYWPSPHEPLAQPEIGEPLAAIIVQVLGDRSVNLTVFDTRGNPYGRMVVPLRQVEDPPIDDMGLLAHCEWMPYQKAQAARAEQDEVAAALLLR